MSECTHFSDELKLVLSQVLFLDVVDTVHSRDARLPLELKWVAGIDFFGDRRGTCLMALSDADSNIAVSFILRKLGLVDMYIPPFTVYPEVLNMISGHMITGLGRYGEAYEITSPRETLDFSPYKVDADEIIKFTTDQGFDIAFYFYMGTGAA